MTGDAVNKLQEINKLMDDIDKKSSKGSKSNYNSSSKDINDAANSMQELINIKKQLDKEFDKDISMFGKNDDMQGVIKARENLESLQKSLKSTQSQMTKLSSMDFKPNAIDKNIINQQKLYRDEISKTDEELQRLKKNDQQARKVTSRVGNRAENATSTGRMNDNQAKQFRSDTSSDRIQNLRNNADASKSRMGDIRKQMEKSRNERSSIANDATMPDQERRRKLASVNEDIQQQEKLIQAHQKSAQASKEAADNIEQYKNSVETSDVKVDPDRNSAKGIMQSRAPSIAMAGIGATAAVVGGMYQRGETANKEMREPSVSIGQRTGQSDFRAVRKQMQEMGLNDNLAYKGNDMLGFQESVLGSQGYTDQEELLGTTQALAEGTRQVPVDNETLTDFMEENMRSGAVRGEDQVKDVQEGFLGAINRTGMEGREKEQLEALKTISAESFTGREGTEEGLENLSAFQTMLADGGSRAVQGENGGELITSLDEGMRNAFDNPKARIAFGQGTEYVGLEGRAQQQEDMEKALEDPENLRKTFNIAEAKAGEGSSEAAKRAVFSQEAEEWFGYRPPMDQIKEMYKQTGGGEKLTEENLNKIAEENKKEGKDQAKKNGQDYEDSKEQTADKSEAASEKQASYLNDFGDAIREVKGSMGGLSPVTYAAIAALTSFTGALLTSAGMAKGSEMLKGKFQKGYSTQKGKNTQKGYNTQKGKKADTTARETGRMGRNYGYQNPGAEPAKSTPKSSPYTTGTSPGMFRNMKDSFSMGKATGGWKGGLQAASNTLGDATKSAGGFKGMAKRLPKSAGGLLKGSTRFMGPLAAGIDVMQGIGNIMGSDDKVKTTGEETGRVGGGLAGAAAGATVGSFAGPLGTAIGGGIGYMTGSGIGKDIGGKIVDFFRGDTSIGETIGRKITDFLKNSWDSVIDDIPFVGNSDKEEDDSDGEDDGKNGKKSKSMLDRYRKYDPAQIAYRGIKSTVNPDYDGGLLDEDTTFGGDLWDMTQKGAGSAWDFTKGLFTPDEADADEIDVGQDKKEKSPGGESSGGFWSSIGDGMSSAWDATKNFFTPEEVSADEIDPDDVAQSAGREQTKKNEKEGKNNEDKDTQRKKANSEKNRKDNTSKEGENMNRYEKLLTRASKILADARSQNGIFGKDDGNGDSDSDSDGGSGDDVSGTSGKGEEAIRSVAKKVGKSLGTDPSLIFGQLMHESANGSHTAGKNNYGGVTYAGQEGASKGAKQPDGNAYYANFDSLDDFANAYKKILDRMGVSGTKDADKYAHKLSQKGYYTAPESEYAASLKDRAKKYANGGKVTTETNAIIGEVPGQDEYVINPNRSSAPGLLKEALSDTFNLRGRNTSQSQSQSSGSEQSRPGGNTNGNSPLNNNVTVNVTVNAEGTPENMAQQIGDSVASASQNAMNKSLDFFSREYRRR